MTCKYQGGYLVSIETEEEWQFINQEIKKTFFLEYYWVAHWFKKERDDLDLGKWSTIEYFEMATKGQKDKRSGGGISKNNSLFYPMSWSEINAFICEMPKGKQKFHR